MDMDFLEIKLTRDDGKTIEIGDVDKLYVLTEVKGLEAAEYYEYTLIKNGQIDGASATSNYVSERIISIQVDCDVNERQALIRFLNPKHTFIAFISYRDKQYRIDCLPSRPQADRIRLRDGEKQLIDFQLICPQPFLKSSRSYVDNMALVLPGFLFPWNGFKSGGQVLSLKALDSKKDIVNDGDVYTPLIVEFVATRGSATNPSMVNHSTGVSFKIGSTAKPLVMQLNDKLVVNATPGIKRIELNGINYFSYFTKGSDFIQLQVGDNMLEYFADDGYSNLDVNISRDYQYLGV